MTKKLITAALGLAALVAFVPTASAQNFESALQNIDVTPGTPYLRYYTPDPASRRVSPGGSSVCPLWDGPAVPNLESTENYCGAVYKTQRRAYRAYSELVANFPPAAPGTIFYALWDMEGGTGADRTGYYAWAGDPVNTTDTYEIFVENCQGTLSPGKCLGPVNPASSVGTDLPNVPGSGAGDATLSPIGGLRPIPVPVVATNSVDPIELNWEAASGFGNLGTGTLSYDLYFAKDSTSDGTCSAREGAFSFLKTVTGTETTVALADIGEAAGNASCVAFAMRLRYPSAGGVNAMTTRYLSRAGQAVILDGGVTAAEVYDLVARRVGASSVEVSWKTSLEDGVRGFYVTRSFTENGTFERVSSLIPAKGEPSAYSFVDQANAQALRVPGRVSGLFYRVEAVDIDDNVTPFGPVKAELGGANQVRPGQRIQRQTR